MKQICKTEYHCDNHSEEISFGNTKQLFKSNETYTGNFSMIIERAKFT